MKTIEIKETKQKTSEIMAEMKSLFKVWSYYSDEELDKQFPVPKKLTTRHFLSSIEPDEATLGKSVKEADPYMKGITLRERMLLEIAYFKETGSHLDIKGWTVCSGSRGSDGYVPCVYFSPDTGGVHVNLYSVDGTYPAGGLRSAVSLDSFNSLPLHSDSLEKAIEEVKAAGYTVSKIL